ncbi:MAG: hypothetical protein WCY25_08385 [Moheibacter sp.]
MRNKIFKTILVVYLWGFYALSLKAQPTDPPGEDDPIYEDPTPIDQWMLVLLMMGVLIATYHFYYKRRNLNDFDL